MAGKKKGKSGKIKAKRVTDKPEKKKLAIPLITSRAESERKPSRASANDDGFGVLKIVAGIIIALVVGSMFLFNQAGGMESARGDKVPGERCKATEECESGTVCYSYRDAEKRCMQKCAKDKTCSPGYTCVSATKQKRRRGFRITDICVEDDTL